jgi:hypothetical protein
MCHVSRAIGRAGPARAAAHAAGPDRGSAAHQRPACRLAWSILCQAARPVRKEVTTGWEETFTHWVKTPFRRTEGSTLHAALGRSMIDRDEQRIACHVGETAMQRILVPLDGSRLAEQVLPHVEVLAPQLGVRVCCCWRFLHSAHHDGRHVSTYTGRFNGHLTPAEPPWEHWMLQRGK